MKNRTCRAVMLLSLMIVLATTGCATIRVTDPPRTADESFLMSRAAEKAVSQLTTAPLRDRLVYVDPTFLQINPDFENSIDRQYLLGTVRAHLLQNGVRLTNDRTSAQIVLEVRSGGVGINRSDYLLGIPQVLVPAVGGNSLDVGGQGTLITPEIAFLKNIKQKGYASVAYVAYWRKTGEQVTSSGPAVGQTYRTDWWYFGAGPYTSGNIAPAQQGQP